MTAPTIDASSAIARFSTGFGTGNLTDAHVRMCGRAIADTVSVAIAGLNEPTAIRAAEYGFRLEGAGPGRLWGRNERVGLETAVLCNGIAAHALDYDDGATPMGGHPSVVLLPSLLALADLRGLDGLAVALAYAVGFETACGIGTALSQAHFERGWHLTSTIGTIASAVACARLLELDADATRHAIGLAFARTGGSRASFGTDAKSLQAGEASVAGLRAALLAETGFTAAPDAIDGPLGFTALYSDGEAIADSLAKLGTAPLVIDASGVEIKKYPACYALHRPLDGLLDLRAEHAFGPDDVASIDVLASRAALAPLLDRLPTDGTEARFSMQYALAAAVWDGAVTLPSFTDEAVRRCALQPLMSRIHSAEANGAVLPRWTELTVTMRNGQVLTRRVEALRGSVQLPLTDVELLRKVADCLAWSSSGIDPVKFMDAAANFATSRVSDLVDVFTTGAPRPKREIPYEYTA